MENILGVGGITISDLNDAIISGDAPRNPDEGALWIDSSANTPVLKVYKNGSWQPQEIDVNNLDPELSETVSTIVNTLGTLANDGLLTYADRLQLSVEIASIIGEIPSKQNGNVYPNTLPAYNIIDSLGVGSFSNLRQSARDATVPTDNTYYIALEQAYTTLNTYLSSLTPRPWDVTLTNKDKNTEVANPDTYRESLLNYYLAEMNLATYTEKRASDAAKEYTDASVQDAITSVDVEYATSTDSNTVPNDDEWDTLAPAWDSGIFIWSRTLTTYKNGTTFISEPVNITGAKGESGGTGAAGRSITKIEEQYYVSDSATERIGGEWENEYPGWEEGKFVWTRSVITFTNPSGTHTTDPISVSGAKGDKGDPGVDAPTIKLSGASQMIKQDALGNVTPPESFTVIGVAVNTTITKWTYSVNGGAFGTALPSSGVTRSGNVVTINPKKVTFNTLSIRAEDGTVTDTFTIGRAVDGEKGAKGDKGDEGLDGIDAITVVLTNESHTFAGGTTNAIAGSASTEFLAFKGANRASVSIGDIAEMPEGMDYNIDINHSQNAKVTFNVTTAMKSRSGIVTIPLTVDGKKINKTFSYSLSLKGDKGDRGEKGATGDKGPIGPTGTGISDVVEWYLATDQSSGIVSPTPENPGNWTTEIQTMTATNKYLWNYEEIKFSDGTSQPTIPVIIGVYGDKGDTGGTGATGRSITAIQEYYMATSASKDVKRPNTDGTNGWTTAMQVTTPTNKYLWNYEKITWSSGTTTTYVEPIIIGVHGEKGDKGDVGADAKLLYLSASAEAMTFNSDNTPNPATQTITFTANMQNTTGTATFTAIPYNGATVMAAVTLGGTGNTRTLTQNQFPAAATRIQIKAVLGSLSDTVSVVKLKNGATGGKGDTGDTGAEGKNAIVGYLTNENITFPANSSGVVTSENLAMANGVFKVFDGVTEKTGSSIKYSVVNQTGATGAITTAGAYSVSNISADNASITFRAIYSDVTIDKVLTLSKSKEGVKGDKGDNAPLVKLSGATQIITESSTGTRTPKDSFTVVGTSVNTSISSWTYSVNGGTFGTGLPGGVGRNGNTVTITPGSITFNTLSIKATGGGVSDTFTIARIVDGEKGAKGDTGSPGGTGSAGADAYTVLLSNESHTFQAGTTSAIGGSTTTDIHAYKGTTKMPVTVGTITGMPTGDMTSSVSNNGKDNVRVTFTVKAGMTSPSGVVTIPIDVDGKIFNKEFSYALSFKGDKGATGDRGPQGPQGATGSRGPIGNTGTSVVSVTEYYLATSASKDVTTDTDGWKTDMQPMSATNKYLWNYEKINFSNNTSQPTIPVIIGVYGDKGNTGATGRSITAIQEYYMTTSASKDVKRPNTDGTNGWTTTMQPTTETNKYLWNYEKITWSSAPLTTYVEPIIIGVHGAKGDQGPRGVSITNVDVEYAQNNSEKTAPTSGWNTTAPSWENGMYIWSRTVTTYSSGNPTQSKPACITGQKGSTGSPGATGTGISSISEEYAISSSKTSAPASSSFSATRPDWSIGQYIWTRSKIVYKNPTSTHHTTPVVSSEWEAINDLEIGGRNLILNSYSLEMTGSDSGNRNVNTFEDGVHSIIPVANGNIYNTQVEPSMELVKGQEYTLSMEISTSTAIGVYWYANSGGSTYSGGRIPNTNGEWIKHEFTYTQTRDSFNGRFLFGFHNLITGSEVKYKNLKLEKGNKATDWTEAPEDTQAKLDEKAGTEYVNTTIKNYNVGIVEGIDDIVATVQADTISKTEFATYQQSLETKFKQDAESFQMDFSNITTSLETIDGAMKEEFDEIEKYIRFVDGKIILGEVGNQITLEISKEKISFLQGEDEVAKLTNNELEITDARIKHELRIGDYAFKPRANGSVDFG